MMRRTNGTRYMVLFALAPILLLSGAVGAGRSAPVSDGWTFIWEVTSDVQSAHNMSMQVRLIQGRIRVDFARGGMPGLSAGSYFLLNSDANEMTIVSPQEKAAMKAPQGGFLALLSSLGVEINVSDVSVNVEDLGSADAVLGKATRRYRITQNYATSFSMMGMNRSARTTNVIDSWISTDFPEGERRSLEAFGRVFGQSLSGLALMGGEGSRKAVDELHSKMPPGFPLRL